MAGALPVHSKMVVVAIVLMAVNVAAAAADCNNEVAALEGGCAGVILAGGQPSQGSACCQAVHSIPAAKIPCVCASVPAPSNNAAINVHAAISNIVTGCGLPSNYFSSCRFN